VTENDTSSSLVGSIDPVADATRNSRERGLYCSAPASVERFGSHSSGHAWRCSRAPGHAGDHVAIDEDGRGDLVVVAHWTAGGIAIAPPKDALPITSSHVTFAPPECSCSKCLRYRERRRA